MEELDLVVEICDSCDNFSVCMESGKYCSALKMWKVQVEPLKIVLNGAALKNMFKHLREDIRG